MSDGEFPYWLLLGIIPVLLLAAVVLNYKRGRRWDAQVRSNGRVHCRNCGYIGELLVRAISARDTSSKLRLVCGRCESSNWFVPEDEKSS
jgi:hypothetical protein